MESGLWWVQKALETGLRDPVKRVRVSHRLRWATVNVSHMKEFPQKNKWPLLISLLAFLVRLVYLLELSGQPGFLVPMVDEKAPMV